MNIVQHLLDATNILAAFAMIGVAIQDERRRAVALAIGALNIFGAMLPWPPWQ